MTISERPTLLAAIPLKWPAVFLIIACSFVSTARADELFSETQADSDLQGDWSLELESGLPAWMRVVEEDGKPSVFMRLYVGPAGPYPAKWDDERLKFEIRRNNKKNGQASVTKVSVGWQDGKLDGQIEKTTASGTDLRETFTGTKVPPMPSSAPDLSKVQFGQPIMLFNGKDMMGWRTYETDKTNGWSVVDGMLVNTTPKTDFSATGSYANLRTEAEYEDFWLHIEFLVEEKRNSGIYLRGMYEAQVVDRDSPMQGIQGAGRDLWSHRSQNQRRQIRWPVANVRLDAGGSTHHRRPQWRQRHRQPTYRWPDRRSHLHERRRTRSDLPARRPYRRQIQRHLLGTGAKERHTIDEREMKIIPSILPIIAAPIATFAVAAEKPNIILVYADDISAREMPL